MKTYRKKVYRGIRPFREGYPFSSDPGDIGRGTYYTSSIHMARAYGKLITKRIKLRNPRFMTSKEIMNMPYDVIHGSLASRLSEAQRFTDDMKALGYDGIVAYGYEGKTNYTIVVF